MHERQIFCYLRGAVFRVLCCFGLGFACCNPLAAQRVAIKNNLLYDLSLTPNLGLEAGIAPRWSVGANAGLNAWDIDPSADRKWRHLLVSPYARWWFSDSTFQRHFLGIHTVYSHYNVGHLHLPLGLYPSLRDHRRQGNLWALGLSYGYHWRLTPHWHMEAEVGAAVGYTRYGQYACGHCGTLLGHESRVFLLPKVGLNIGYYLGRKHKAEPEPLPEPVAEPVAEPQPYVPVLSVVPDNTGRAGRLQADNPVLEHISRYRPYDRTRILRKERGALYVNFPVGRSDLQPDYRSNAATLERIVDLTRQILADTTSEVRRIQIVGLASIEGSTERNEALAMERAQALKHYIQQHAPTPDSLYDVSGGGEAWAELRDQLHDALLAAGADTALLAAAIRVIDSEPDEARREQRLRTLRGGQAYRYIHTQLLPDQRNSGYLRVYYDYVPDTAAQTINRASRLLQTERPAEALALLKPLQADSRAWNALGVALYLTGQPDEGLRYMRQAAANGNADARENLKHLTEDKQ